MKTFLVFPKTMQQTLWEAIRHELSRQYVVPSHMSEDMLAEFLINLTGSGPVEAVVEVRVNGRL